MKKVLLIISVLLILAAIPITILLVKQQQDIRQRAAPASTLYFDPTPTSIAKDQNLTLNLKLDSGSNYVSFVQADIAVDAQYFEIISFQVNSALMRQLQEPIKSPGAISVHLGYPTSTSQLGAHGDGLTLGTLTLRAITPTQAGTPTPVRILWNGTGQGPSTANGAPSAPDDYTDPDYGKDVLVAAPPAQVTITDGTGPAATPSPRATPLGTPLATPRATPGGSPVATPVASPRATPPTGGGASPSPRATPAQVTRIITPANGARITDRTPVISGESFTNATLALTLKLGNTVVINPPPSLIADASGEWSYQVLTDLQNGAYTVNVTATDPDTDATQTASSTFTVIDEGSTGGDDTPAASSIPVTGAATPTFFLLGLAVLLLTFGAGLAFLF